jgi:hypothetical protein
VLLSPVAPVGVVVLLGSAPLLVLVGASVLLEVPLELLLVLAWVSVASVVVAGLAGQPHATSARTRDVETSEPRCCMRGGHQYHPSCGRARDGVANFRPACGGSSLE